MIEKFMSEAKGSIIRPIKNAYHSLRGSSDSIRTFYLEYKLKTDRA